MAPCVVFTCKNMSQCINYRTDGVTYHRFPSKPEVKEKWILATGRGPVWWPSKSSTICSIHFKENEFRPLAKSRRLFDWAVPTLKLPVKLTTGSKTPQGEEPQDDSTDTRGLKRKGFICTSCTNDITGSRYICLQCTDCVLCFLCEGKGVHGHHYVLRVPAAKPSAEVVLVLNRIRNQLKGILDQPATTSDSYSALNTHNTKDTSPDRYSCTENVAKESEYVTTIVAEEEIKKEPEDFPSENPEVNIVTHIGFQRPETIMGTKYQGIPSENVLPAVSEEMLSLSCDVHIKEEIKDPLDAEVEELDSDMSAETSLKTDNKKKKDTSKHTYTCAENVPTTQVSEFDEITLAVASIKSEPEGFSSENNREENMVSRIGLHPPDVTMDTKYDVSDENQLSTDSEEMSSVTSEIHIKEEIEAMDEEVVELEGSDMTLDSR